MYYNNIYFENPLFSFIVSIFLSLILINLSLYPVINKKKKNNFFPEYQPLIIFFLLFSFIVFIFNILILFKLSFKINIYFIVFLLLISFCISLFEISRNKKNFINFFSFKQKKFIYFIFAILFLISLLPVSDADSIAIHQLIANYIYLNGLDKINLFKNVEFLSLSNT